MDIRSPNCILPKLTFWIVVSVLILVLCLDRPIPAQEESDAVLKPNAAEASLATTLGNLSQAISESPLSSRVSEDAIFIEKDGVLVPLKGGSASGLPAQVASTDDWPAASAAGPGAINDLPSLTATGVPGPGYTFAPTFAATLQDLSSDAYVDFGVYKTGKLFNGVKQRDLLPAPREANDLFYTHRDQSLIDQTNLRLGDGRIFALQSGRQASREAIIPRLKITPAFGIFFDTGDASDNFDVTTFPLGKSPAAGQTKFISNDTLEVPLSIGGDLQIRDLAGQHVQLFAEANNFSPDSNDLVFSGLFARVLTSSSTSVLAGKTFSMFGTNGYICPSLQTSGTLIGTSQFADRDDNVIQLRFQKSVTQRMSWGVALEKPFRDDVEYPVMSTPLTRWPTFSGNVVYQGANEFDRLQLSFLNRTLGFEAGSGEEFFDSAWGFSGYARKQISNSPVRQSELFVGLVGGEGVGNYVHGVDLSAAFDGVSFDTLDGLGTYVGYGSRRLNRCNKRVDFNLAYGYATMESPAFLPPEANSHVQQGFANIIFHPKENVAWGFEYQYGRRKSESGVAGENNRLMFVVAITTLPKKSLATSVIQPQYSFVESKTVFAQSRYEEVIPPDREGGYAYQFGL